MTDVLRSGAERAKAGRWRGEQAVAYLNPVPDAPPPSEAFLRQCLVTLRDQGFSRVVTGALSPPEQRGFLAAGFAVEQRLHLLCIELHAGLPFLPDGPPLHRATRRDRPQVLAVDAAAFSPFWRFDADGLRGGFQNVLSVYGRHGLACPRCTREIVRTVVAQRGTWWCRTCQKP